MKPGEFDDLVRQKFDQNDFEYNPRNWDKLTEELDGQKKKRGLLFWWMPLLGVAATVAMAFGVSTVLLKSSGAGDNHLPAQYAANDTKAKSTVITSSDITTDNVIPAQETIAQNVVIDNTTPTTIVNNIKTEDKKATTNAVKIYVDNITGTNTAMTSTTTKIMETFSENDIQKKKKKPIVVTKALYTFKEEETKKKETKVAIILSGGVNYSNQSSGYTVGATARRMINDKVYVESDIAFIGTNNTQKVQYLDKTGTSAAAYTLGNGTNVVFGAKNSAGKNTDQASKVTDGSNAGVIKTADQSYNLYYAQITPSIGCKIMKRLSVGAGPDFQQMLVDNRPEASTVDRGNIKTAPVFDIGFMGKTEYAIAKNIKAAVYYREGINNVITPTNKYIDRNYLQFQIKCTILNR